MVFKDSVVVQNITGYHIDRLLLIKIRYLLEFFQKIKLWRRNFELRVYIFCLCPDGAAVNTRCRQVRLYTRTSPASARQRNWFHWTARSGRCIFAPDIRSYQRGTIMEECFRIRNMRVIFTESGSTRPLKLTSDYMDGCKYSVRTEGRRDGRANHSLYTCIVINNTLGNF